MAEPTDEQWEVERRAAEHALVMELLPLELTDEEMTALLEHLTVWLGEHGGSLRRLSLALRTQVGRPMRVGQRRLFTEYMFHRFALQWLQPECEWKWVDMGAEMGVAIELTR